MNKRGIIDRFEGEWAVLEFETGMEDILKTTLPKNISVGDVLVFGDTTITIDTDARKQREAEIDRLADELFEDE